MHHGKRMVAVVASHSIVGRPGLSPATRYRRGRSVDGSARWRADIGLLVLLASTLLMPLTDQFNAVRLAIAIGVFAWVFTRPVASRLRSFPAIYLLFVFVNVLMGAIISLLAEGSVVWGPIAHEMVRTAYYTLIMAAALRLRGRLSTLVLGCQVLLLLNLAVQLLQLARPDLINSWISTYYPTDTSHLELATYSWPDFRSGSIYVNPNVYAVFPPLFLSVFLQASRLSALKWVGIWVSLCIVSDVLTGSRMGLILMLAVILAWWTRVGERGVRRWRGAPLIGVMLVMSLPLLVPNLTNLQDRARSLDFGGSLGNSLGVKVDLFLGRLTTMTPLYLPFGDLGSPSAGAQDMELAHVAIHFGLAGILWYSFLLAFLARASRDRLPLVSISGIMLILLGSLAASTVLNMAAFPLFVLVMLVDWRQTSPGDTERGLPGSSQLRVGG